MKPKPSPRKPVPVPLKDRDWLTIRAAERLHSLPKFTLNKFILDGTLAAYEPVRNHFLVKKEDVAAVLEGRKLDELTTIVIGTSGDLLKAREVRADLKPRPEEEA
jgi:hypothetical protein